MAPATFLLLPCAVLAVSGGYAPAASVRRALEGGDDHDHEEEDDGHGHGDKAWEWAGIFETTPSGNDYVWTAQKVEQADGTFRYADPMMKMVLLPASEASDEKLHELEEEAEHGFEETCTVVEANGKMIPKMDACYEIHFDENALETFFFIEVAGAIAIFTQHGPTEFERPDNSGIHYMRDNMGVDIEPVAELPEPPSSGDGNSDDWGLPIGASFVVLVCTLVGVVFVAPQVARFAKKYPAPLTVSINSFAAGALLAAAFYLMLYEATHLIFYQEESESAGMWGTMILLGFLAPTITDIIIQAIRDFIISKYYPDWKEEDETTTAKKAVEENGNGHVDSEAVQVASKAKQTRVLIGVLMGDFMHNLADGIVIGTAFKGCNSTMGWTITAATVYHELAQEISDYLVLTDPAQGNLKPLKALFLNFITGTSVIFGVIIIMASDVENISKGCLLAFGGGIYLQIAASECMPRVYEVAKDTMLRLLGLFLFCLGCVGIGLVLLDHEHCVPGGGDADADPHAGHAH